MAILLIDDNPHVAESLSVAIRLAGHRLDHAGSPEEALSRLARKRFDVVLLDLNYGPGRTDGAEGLTLLGRIVADDPAARIVVITAHSGVRVAVAAMRAGACDFVMKPWRNAELVAALEAAARPEQAHNASETTPPTAESSAPVRLIGDSPAIEQVRALVRRVGPSKAGVVITGAPGSGRSLTAAVLHAASDHADTPMLSIDLRDPEAWSRLEGAKGSVLLRHPDRLGEVEQRRLHERLPVSARAIAIADDPRRIGAALARRIATVEIAVPRLADRGDDALLLARHFLWVTAERHNRAVPRLSAAAEAMVLRTSWPDEVRGLAAAIERALLLHEDAVLEAEWLSPARAALPPLPADEGAPSFDLDENERLVIEAALRQHRYNVTHAAGALGLSRGALYRRMTRYGL
ncbi:sigma-54-dependent transcriptional regulator [Sphingomonas azotifigens]|uniref:sigma-54-dependent transcriptional regulator n=1 Tax=Sphingomonas azotifigens TaxID=330920 RepID=UPI002481B2A2|nr:response regulator [Sphingomonas azotifigens]